MPGRAAGAEATQRGKFARGAGERGGVRRGAAAGQRVRRANGRSPPTAALWHFLGTGKGVGAERRTRGGGARSPACLFTAGEAALYFARVAGCFGTAGGGGAQGNKSVVGREGGWGEERRPSRSSCQTPPPCLRPQPALRPARVAWSLPAHRTRARPAEPGRPPLCGSAVGSALSCQPPQGGSDDRAGR